MTNFPYDSLVSTQEHWKQMNIPDWKKSGMIALVNVLMHRLIDNNHDIEKVELQYPEDCDNFDVFRDVAYGLSAFVTKRDSGGLAMNGFGHCRDEIEVE